MLIQSNIRNLWFGASFAFAAVLGLFSGSFTHGLVGLVTFGALDDATYAALLATPAVGFTCGIVLIGLVAFVLGYIGLAAYDAVTCAMSLNRLNILRKALYGEETPSREAFVDCFELSPELTQAARRHAEKLYVYATRKKQSGTAFSVLRATQSAGQTFRQTTLVDRRLLVWLFRVLPSAFIGTGVFGFAAALAAGTPVGVAAVALAVGVFGAMIVAVFERGITGFRHAQLSALCDDIDNTFRPSGESVSLEEIVHASHESAELIANATLATQEDFRATMQAASKEIAAKLDQNSSAIVNTLTETAKSMGPDVSDAVTKALADPIEQLRSATETATSEQSEQVRELIKTVLEGFVTELKSIVGDEFSQIDQLIKASTESAGKLEQVYTEAFVQMADHSKTLGSELTDEFKSVIGALRSEEAERVKAQVESVQSITDGFKQVIDGLKAQEADWAKVQGEALGSVAGEFKSVIETLKAEEVERVKAQTESVGSLIGEFRSVIGTLRTEESERVKAQVESVGTVMGEFKAAIEAMKADEAERVRTQSDSMKAMTSELGESLKVVTDGLAASIKEIAGSASTETKEMATALTAETKDIAAAMAADANRHVEAFNEALDRAMTSLESMANQQLQQTTEDLSRTASSFETLHTSLENIVTLMSPMISQVIDNQESLLRAIESESSNSRVLSRAASEMSAAAQVSRTTVDRFLALAEVLRETSTNIGRAANTNTRGVVSPPRTAKKAALKAGGSSFGDAIRQLRQTSHEDEEPDEE